MNENIAEGHMQKCSHKAKVWGRYLELCVKACSLTWQTSNVVNVDCSMWRHQSWVICQYVLHLSKCKCYFLLEFEIYGFKQLWCLCLFWCCFTVLVPLVRRGFFVCDFVLFFSCLFVFFLKTVLSGSFTITIMIWIDWCAKHNWFCQIIL